jgi:hypothetical protein
MPDAKPGDGEAESEFAHFADLAKHLLAVPKAEVNGKRKRRRRRAASGPSEPSK